MEQKIKTGAIKIRKLGYENEFKLYGKYGVQIVALKTTCLSVTLLDVRISTIMETTNFAHSPIKNFTLLS